MHLYSRTYTCVHPLDTIYTPYIHLTHPIRPIYTTVYTIYTPPNTRLYTTVGTVWDIETGQADTQLIAHDKEVYDVSFARGTEVFASVGADGRYVLDPSYYIPGIHPFIHLRTPVVVNV